MKSCLELTAINLSIKRFSVKDVILSPIDEINCEERSPVIKEHKRETKCSTLDLIQSVYVPALSTGFCFQTKQNDGLVKCCNI